MKNLVRPLTRCLVLLLICCPAVHARLKDSETEARERYGEIAARDAESAKVIEKIKALV